MKPFDSSTLAVKDNFPSALGTDDLDEGGKRFWPIDAASNPVGDVIVERAAVTQNVTQQPLTVKARPVLRDFSPLRVPPLPISSGEKPEMGLLPVFASVALLDYTKGKRKETAL